MKKLDLPAHSIRPWRLDATSQQHETCKAFALSCILSSDSRARTSSDDAYSNCCSNHRVQWGRIDTCPPSLDASHASLVSSFLAHRTSACIVACLSYECFVWEVWWGQKGLGIDRQQNKRYHSASINMDAESWWLCSQGTVFLAPCRCILLLLERPCCTGRGSESRVTSMNRRNCVKRFTESYWENLMWNLAGGIIAWVNQLIILSSIHKSKQEMSSGRASSALFSNLASLCFQCINMESAPIPEVPLKESVLDLMASAFQQQDRKNVHHIAYTSNFASGRLAHFEWWRNSLTYSKAWITLASPVAVVSFQALFLQAKYSSSPWSAMPKCLWCSSVDVWFKERQLHPA